MEASKKRSITEVLKDETAVAEACAITEMIVADSKDPGSPTSKGTEVNRIAAAASAVSNALSDKTAVTEVIKRLEVAQEDPNSPKAKPKSKFEEAITATPARAAAVESLADKFGI